MLLFLTEHNELYLQFPQLYCLYEKKIIIIIIKQIYVFNHAGEACASKHPIRTDNYKKNASFNHSYISLSNNPRKYIILAILPDFYNPWAIFENKTSLFEYHKLDN